MIIAIISAINWLNLGKEIITFIANGIKSLASQAPNIIKSIFEKAVEFIKNISWDATGKTVIAYLVGGIKGVGSMIVNGLKQLFIDGVNAIKGIDWIGVGKNIIQGIVNGIKALGGQIKEVLLGLASSAFKGVKDFFGIHSPSRKMRDEIGKYIPEGMALGIRDHADDVIKAMDDLEQIPEDVDVGVNGSASLGGSIVGASTESRGSMSELVELLKYYLPRIEESQIVLDTGILVGQTASAMDKALGGIYQAQERYV
jgi:phage-related protein